MTEPLRVRVTDFVLQRDLHWQPSECEHTDLRKKLEFVIINRVSQAVQTSLLADEKWLKQQEEQKQEQKGASVTTREVAGPDGYQATEVSVPMDEWGPEFFEQLSAGERPTLRSDLPPAPVDSRALALQASMDELFEPGGLFDPGDVDDEDAP